MKKQPSKKFSCRRSDCGMLGKQLPPARHLGKDSLESGTGGSLVSKITLFSLSLSLCQSFTWRHLTSQCLKGHFFLSRVPEQITTAAAHQAVHLKRIRNMFCGGCFFADYQRHFAISRVFLGFEMLLSFLKVKRLDCKSHYILTFLWPFFP